MPAALEMSSDDETPTIAAALSLDIFTLARLPGWLDAASGARARIIFFVFEDVRPAGPETPWQRSGRYPSSRDRSGGDLFLR
jgi:hypothetical protein